MRIIADPPSHIRALAGKFRGWLTPAVSFPPPFLDEAKRGDKSETKPRCEGVYAVAPTLCFDEVFFVIEAN